MRNLATNQHGVYTFRKGVGQNSIRISLRTKDKLEAIRIADRISTLLSYAKSDSPTSVKLIALAVLNEMNPVLRAERIKRVEGMLNIELERDDGLKLSELVIQFIEEKVRSNAWTEKTQATYQVNYDNLLELLGDKWVKDICNRDVQFVKSCLQKLPSNLNKRQEYRGKGLRNVLQLDIPESHLMSIKTINIKLGCYAELFKWGLRNGFIDRNVFEGVGLKDRRSVKELRLPFTPQDLKAIFSAEPILSYKFDWHFWVPVLGLYTGARLNEICQLQIKDVVQIDGIWCLSINNDGANQSIKAAASKRIIPIHRDVISLGFIEFCCRSNANKDALVFEELQLRNGQYGQIPSKWFGYLKKKVLKDDMKKAFHSFRHTFVDYMFNRLKLQGSPLVKALVGHADNEITSGIYGSSYEVNDLNNIIQGIDFQAFGLEIYNHKLRVRV